MSSASEKRLLGKSAALSPILGVEKRESCGDRYGILMTSWVLRQSSYISVKPGGLNEEEFTETYLSF